MISRAISLNARGIACSTLLERPPRGFSQSSAAAMRRAFSDGSTSSPSSILVSRRIRKTACRGGRRTRWRRPALDVDDGHRMAAGHPGAAVVCAAIAAAEQTAPTRGEFNAANSPRGWIAAVRVALARNPEHHSSTVSGRWSGVGAAVAAAKLFRLDSTSMANAILIAEQHAPRVSAAQASRLRRGRMSKEGISWSVYTGLYAMQFAREGFVGYPDAFDQGILYDPNRLIVDIGAFESIKGLFFKALRVLQMDACPRLTARLRSSGSLKSKPSSIEKIVVDTFQHAVGLSNRPNPKSDTEAQFSIPFCISLAILRGANSLLPIEARHLDDRSVVSLGQARSSKFRRRTGILVSVSRGRIGYYRSRRAKPQRQGRCAFGGSHEPDVARNPTDEIQEFDAF